MKNVNLSTEKGLMASAGMYYNFGNIKFKYGSASGNEGYYKSINNDKLYNANTSEAKTGFELFIKQTIANRVRTITVPEINRILGRENEADLTTISEEEDSKGIFRLDQLNRVPGIDNINYQSSYILASPHSHGHNHVVYISKVGKFDWLYMSNPGNIRPVISLKDANYRLEKKENGTYKFVR